MGEEINHKHKYHYVSVLGDHGKYGIVAGPWATHDEAVKNVRRVSDIAIARDPRAFWYGWGTCSSDERFVTVFERAGIVLREKAL